MKYQDFPVELQRQIEDDIAVGDLSVGQKVSLEELNHQFRSSAEDIQQVLPRLERKGLIKIIGSQSIQILGLYKAEIESVFQYAEKSKMKPETVVRSVKVEPAEKSIAEILRIPEGDPLFIQVRTRIIDDQILANQYNFIPYEVCPGLDKVDLTRSSFQVMLEKRFRTVITRIEESYSLDLPNRDDAEILSITNDEPVLIVQRTSFSQTEYPLVFADIHVNPAQFHYVKDLWPKALPLVSSLN
jgi:GntR family transcriptional regulator